MTTEKIEVSGTQVDENNTNVHMEDAVDSHTNKEDEGDADQVNNDADNDNENEKESAEVDDAEGEDTENGSREKDVVEEEDFEGEEEEDLLQLPLSKIKKIFKMDPDYTAASQSAVYATGLATELFIQYFVENASSLAKRAKRKKITYADCSDAVKSHDSLMFLRDTIPEMQKLEDLIAKKLLDKEGHPTETALSAAKGKFDSGEDDTRMKKNDKTPLGKGQQTLKFVSMTQSNEDKPIKKAVIHDLIASDETPALDVMLID